VSIFIADSHATTSTITLVIGIERTRESGRRSARVRVGKLESLHSSNRKVQIVVYDTKLENSFMLFSNLHFLTTNV
jgi:hypothetical protein